MLSLFACCLEKDQKTQGTKYHVLLVFILSCDCAFICFRFFWLSFQKLLHSQSLKQSFAASLGCKATHRECDKLIHTQLSRDGKNFFCLYLFACYFLKAKVAYSI